jgi:hypothetical protein
MKTFIALIALTITAAHVQDPTHATKFCEPTPGPGPNGVSNPTFLFHSLGNDHAEGITTLDMRRDYSGTKELTLTDINPRSTV